MHGTDESIQMFNEERAAEFARPADDWQKAIREAQAQRDAEQALQEARERAEREARERHEHALDGRVLSVVLAGLGIEVGELDEGVAVISDYRIALTSRWARPQGAPANDKEPTHELRVSIAAQHVDDDRDSNSLGVPSMQMELPARITGEFEQVELVGEIKPSLKARFADMLDEAARQADLNRQHLAFIAAEESPEWHDTPPAPPTPETLLSADALSTLADRLELDRTSPGFVTAMALLEIAHQLRQLNERVAEIANGSLTQL